MNETLQAGEQVGTPLIVCHECDLVQRQPVMPEGGKALCSRCGATLFSRVPDSIERTIPLAVAGLILFVIANTFPFLSFEIGSQVTQTTLFTGVRQLYEQGAWLLAGLVFFTCIAAPLVQLLLVLYIYLPLNAGHVAHYTREAFRLLQALRDWNMIEVFMIGILVALVKLLKMATIVPGIALWSFLAMIFIITATLTAVDGELIWRRLDEAGQS